MMEITIETKVYSQVSEKQSLEKRGLRSKKLTQLNPMSLLPHDLPSTEKDAASVRAFFRGLNISVENTYFRENVNFTGFKEEEVR